MHIPHNAKLIVMPIVNSSAATISIRLSNSTMLAPIHCRPRVFPPLAKCPFPEYQTKHKPYPFVYCCVFRSCFVGDGQSQGGSIDPQLAQRLPPTPANVSSSVPAICAIKQKWGLSISKGGGAIIFELIKWRPGDRTARQQYPLPAPPPYTPRRAIICSSG